jgi:hypothetical protein
MAVRDDFTAGEVLAAADLNDTFASKLPYSFGTATPSSPGDGELWVDTSGSPNKPSVKFYDGAAFQPVAGLTLITTETFSAVSSVSINGCFTADYANYRIVVNGGIGSTSGDVTMRYRASGSDASGSDYVTNGALCIATGVFAISTGFATSGRVGVSGFSTTSSRWGNILIESFEPNEAGFTHTQATSQGLAGGSANAYSAQGFHHGVAASYDGFTLIFPGTQSGTIRVYGYKD